MRLFEAAACGRAIISDRWAGIDTFFTPGHEILLADSADDVASILQEIDPEECQEIGRRARQRVLAEHTPAHRAFELEQHLYDALEAGAMPSRAHRSLQPVGHIHG